MGNLIVSITIFFSIMLCSTTSVASCADSPYLASIKKSDESFYNVNLFSICAQKKECSIANESLLKLKNSDQVAFSFVKGISLANGDCTKQDVGGALRNLKYCSKYSVFCKANLILLCQNMSLYDEEYFKIAVSAIADSTFPISPSCAPSDPIPPLISLVLSIPLIPFALLAPPAWGLFIFQDSIEQKSIGQIDLFFCCIVSQIDLF